MRRQNRTEITVESARMVVIRRCCSLRAWCEPCACEVDMVGLDEAEAIAGIEQPMLRAPALVQTWHISQGENGEFLVCLDSLLKSL